MQQRLVVLQVMLRVAMLERVGRQRSELLGDGMGEGRGMSKGKERRSSVMAWTVQTGKTTNLGRSGSSQELEGIRALCGTLGCSMDYRVRFIHMGKSCVLYWLIGRRMMSANPKALEHRERCSCWLEGGRGWLERGQCGLERSCTMLDSVLRWMKEQIFSFLRPPWQLSDWAWRG